MIDRPLEANLAMKRKSLEEHLETAIQDENDFLGLHLFKSNREIRIKVLANYRAVN